MKTITPTESSSVVNIVKKRVIAELRASTYVEPWFLTEHVLEVEKYALWLCDLYREADREAVILSV